MMGNWYYVDGEGQRHGPLTADVLAELSSTGGIHPGTLVWREGLSEWQPLSGFFDELGIPAAVTSPVLPRAPAGDAANSLPPVAHPEHQKRGMSGCLIAILVAFVAGIVLLAILAAIALPAYQDYVTRATVARTMMTANSISLAASAFQAEHDRCPDNGEGGLLDAGSYATDHVADIRVGPTSDPGRCSVQITLKQGRGRAAGGTYIRLEQDASTGTWHCSSDMGGRNLPSNCRN